MKKISKVSLIDEAKKVVTNSKKNLLYETTEWEDLAIAWIKGEVTTKQVGAVILNHGGTTTGGGVLYMVAKAIKTAYEKGRIKIL